MVLSSGIKSVMCKFVNIILGCENFLGVGVGLKHRAPAPGPSWLRKLSLWLGASAAETINQARAVLATKKPGQKIYITNNLPYIRRLNDGYSKQAPAGFVERAVLIGRKMRKNFKIKG